MTGTKRQRMLVSAIAVVVLGAIIAIVTMYEAGERDKHQHAARRLLREEAHELVRDCNPAVFATQIGKATAKLVAYVEKDRAHAADVLDGVVMPVIDAREVACAGAKRDLDKLAADDDAWARGALTGVDPTVAVVASTRAAAEAFGSAVRADGTGSDELVAKAKAVRAAATP